ncbi:ABC transporter substrate-binding protein [Candidatus Similichlamydia laticola]|uniref:ABC transporter substrate-binding protein n=1 Tax=Candidatus Similichlamydia laticola TaxID=2170265 RepID=UPI0015F05A14|nr:ABC transporter substrate-binding protein [Candidatus Similichlamydia laticola]
MKKRLLFLLIPILAVVSVLFSMRTQTEQREPGQVLRLHLNSFPILDPRSVAFSHASSLIVIPMLYRGLTRIDFTGAPSLCLASSFRIDQEGQLYIFKLKRELWSDGTPITSRDFAESWRSSLDPAFPSLSSTLLFCIRNAERIKQGEADPQSLGVYTPNDEELLVELEYFIPVETFLEMLSKPPFFAAGSYTEEGGISLLYNGPYLPIRSKKKSQIFELKKNPFCSEEAFFPLVRFLISEKESYPLLLFSRFELDWIGAPNIFLTGDLFFAELGEKIERVCSEMSVGTFWLICNTDSPKLSSEEKRWKLYRMLDRDSLCCLLGQDFSPAYNLFPDKTREGAQHHGHFTFSKEEPDREPLHLLFRDRSCEPLIASCVGEQIEKTGTQVKIRSVRALPAFLSETENNEFDLAVFKWVWTCRDPYEFFSVFLSQNCGIPKSNSRQLLAEFEEEQKKRGKKNLFWIDLEREVMKTLPVIPLVHEPFRALKRKELQNVIVLPGGQVDFSRAYWEASGAK